MRKRWIKRALAVMLCLGLSFGMFDGIPLVKEISGVQEVEAAGAPKGICGNGTGGINININAAPYTTFKGYAMGYNAYTKVGCAWFASARANQLTGKGNTIWSGQGWNNRYKTLGYSKGTEIKAPAIICWQNHVAILEKIVGNTAYISEGGNWWKSNADHGYTIIRAVSASGVKSLNSGFLGFVYLTGKPKPITYTLTTGNASSITNTNAKISGSMSPACTVSSWGFYLGASQNAMKSYSVGGSTKSANMSCDVNKYVKLSPGTTYYYKMWAKVNGETKQGSVKSFKTTATKPDIPTLKINNENKDIGLESSATVNWSAVGNTTHYKLYLYDEEENLIEQSENVTGTKYAFSAAQKTGTFTARIEAYNEVGTKGKSDAVTFTVHPDVTVTFMDADSFVDVGEDYEPAKLGEQTVHYGGAASAPAKPEHTGYTFQKWSDGVTNVKEDMTVKAVYDINRYKVTYIDSATSATLGKEEVEYYSAANPVDYDVPTGYAKTGYDGWDKDYKCIAEDTILRTSIGWYNENFPIYAEILSAEREYDSNESDNEGYTVKARVTNWDKSTTKGRVIVALKTKNGKLLTTTESSAFSIKKSVIDNPKRKELEIFVPYEKAASRAEIYVVGQYADAVPIASTMSNKAGMDIDQTKAYTNWSTEVPPENVGQKEERTEYRYKDKSTTTSDSSSLAGWTQSGSSWVKTGSGTIEYVPSFPSGFSTTSSHYKRFHKTPVTAYENATKKRTVSTSNFGYVYYHWCKGATLSAPTNRLVDGCKTSARQCFHAFTQSNAIGWNASAKAYYASHPSICRDTYWWIGYGEAVNQQIPIKSCSYTDYKKQFSYYKWSDFSDWSTNQYTASATRTVESRKVYRYLDENLMKEDDSGEERIIEGSAGEEFAGKEATLFIYKVDEASDFTNEYVSQVKLDEKGNYKFAFKLREEPSVKTGDMTVALGIEGNSTAIYLDTIEAPKKKYKVRFLDFDGSVISEQEVEEGKGAELPAPEKTERTGYTFTKWSDTNVNITEDKDIYAEYSLNKYNVVFVDWKANTVDVKEFEYGARLVTPIAEEPDVDEIVEWDAVAKGIDTVTENLIVCTQYKKKTFPVKIYGFDGELIDEQTVEYGKAVVLPELDAEANSCVFYGWKNIAEGSEKEFTDTVIKQETILVPDFAYIDTVEMPTASVKTGEYDSAQTVTLSTPTEGADIYYTLDGTNPAGKTGIHYTQPIKIEDAAVLKYYAVAKRKNDSEVGTSYYVINYNGARSAWMPYDKLPDEIKGDISSYEIYSDTGYSYAETSYAALKKEADELTTAGWQRNEAGDTWSDYSDWQDSIAAEKEKYIEIETETQQLYDTVTKYKYSHYVYTENGEKKYAAAEIDGKDCEKEELELDSSLAIGGFTDKGEAYFIQDGVNWYNQTKSEGRTKTGEKYRYRYKKVSYKKWSAYTLETPAENEQREYIQKEVYSYIRHKKYLVNICGYSGVLETQIIEQGDKIDNTVCTNITGYQYEGLYLDADYTQKWEETKGIENSMDVYVKLTPLKYQVIFEDAKGNKLDEQMVDYLEEATAPKPTAVEDMCFVSWSTNDYMCVDRDMVVKAQYIPEDEYAMVSLDKEKLNITVDEEEALSATITPLSESESTLLWESSDNGVAIVSDQGIVTGIDEGTATITATVEATGESAECLVSVTAKSVDDESAPPEQSAAPGQTNAPGQSTAPGQSAAPGQTNAPGQSIAPGQSAAPGQTNAPGQSTAPGQSAAPGQTNAPAKTALPTGSAYSTVPTPPLSALVPGSSNSLTNQNQNNGQMAGRKGKVPARAASLKIKFRNKSFEVSWKKQSGVAGYQLQYALDKKFTKQKKSKLVKKNKVSVKKLKKKLYYVRVRAYNLNGKKKVYGAWSKVKKGKVK